MKKTVLLILILVLVSSFLLTACDNIYGEPHRIYFESEGAHYAAVYTNGNQIISLPNEPDKEGFDFDGWFFDKDVWQNKLTADYYANKSLKNDVYVYAKFSEEPPYIPPEYPEEPISDEDFIVTLNEDGETVTITGYNTDKADELVTLEIPETIGEYPITAIAEKAFFNIRTIETVFIPETILTIGLGAFKGCDKLSQLSIPFIGQSRDENNFLAYIFGATSYENYEVIPESLKTIMLYNEEITIINEGAFQNCRFLESIIIPATVVEIENSAFMGCRSIESITLPVSLEKIGQYVFYGCYELREIIIPSLVSEIAKDAFSLCLKLDTIIIEAIVPPVIYVPDDYIEDYLADESWNTYQDRIFEIKDK